VSAFTIGKDVLELNIKQQNYNIIPKAIYLDTNILFQLGHGKVREQFLELKEVSRNIKVDIFVPEIVFEERINQIKREILEAIEKLDSASRRLCRILGREPLKYENPPEDVDTWSKDNVTIFLKDAGIKMIPTPENLSLDTIIKMAIKKEPPFEEKEIKDKKVLTGFNDTIILFTIIEHMKANAFPYAFIVSADKIFQDENVINRFKKSGLNISILEGVDDAKNKLNTQIEDALASIIAEKKKKIKDFLNTKSDEIFKYVIKNARVNKSFVRGTGLERFQLPYNITIKKILGTRPKEISSVFPGHISTQKVEVGKVEPITFSVAVEFDVFVRDTSSLKEPRVSLASIEDLEEMVGSYYEWSEYQEIITRDITVEAEIIKENDHYSELKLLRVITY